MGRLICGKLWRFPLIFIFIRWVADTKIKKGWGQPALKNSLIYLDGNKKPALICPGNLAVLCPALIGKKRRRRKAGGTAILTTFLLASPTYKLLRFRWRRPMASLPTVEHYINLKSCKKLLTALRIIIQK